MSKGFYKILCKTCGEELSMELIEGDLYIPPCKPCLKKEYSKGFEDGIEDSDEKWIDLTEKRGWNRCNPRLGYI